MRRDLTDARFHHASDGRRRAGPAAHHGITARTLCQPMHATANFRVTVWLIAGLLLVWAIIVAR